MLQVHHQTMFIREMLLLRCSQNGQKSFEWCWNNVEICIFSIRWCVLQDVRSTCLSDGRMLCIFIIKCSNKTVFIKCWVIAHWSMIEQMQAGYITSCRMLNVREHLSWRFGFVWRSWYLNLASVSLALYFCMQALYLVSFILANRRGLAKLA